MDRYISSIAASTLFVLALAGTPRRAAALEADLDDGNFKVRWTNTMRSTLGLRTTSPDPLIGNNPAFTASEYSFDKGHFDTARVDWLSDLDAAYEGTVGARATFAGWYDYAYQNHTVTVAPPLQSAGMPSSYAGTKLSDYTLDRYRGPWGEFLDAYGWGKFALGPVPVSVKAGRHTVVWGEAVTLGGNMHGIAYSQDPLDLAKAFANPGAERKELIRPLNRVSLDAQLLPKLTLSGDYVLGWESYIYPEGGTFAGPADFAFNGPAGQFARLGKNSTYFMNGGSNDPGTHDWGAGLRYADVFGGTAGLYYRHYADKLPAVLVVPNPGAQGPLSPSLNSPLQYQQFYGEGVDLVGASYSKKLSFAITSVEASYRHDTPLTAQTLGLTLAPSPALASILFPHGAPHEIGNTYQARGDTFHVVAGARGMLPTTAVWSAAAWNVEGVYDRLITVRENQDMFYGMGYGVCRSDPALVKAGSAKNKNDGCATANAAGLSAGFSPSWKNVFNGVDLFLPLQGTAFFWGNSPVQLGGNAGSGTYSAGVGAEIRKTVRLDLKYMGFYGNTIDNGKVVTSNNGLLSLLKNRESVVFLAKTSF